MEQDLGRGIRIGWATSRSALSAGMIVASLFAACNSPAAPDPPPELPPGVPGLPRLTCTIDDIDTQVRTVDIDVIINGGPRDARYSDMVDWGDGVVERPRLFLEESADLRHMYERRGPYLIDVTVRNEATSDRLSCGLSAEVGFCDVPHVRLDDDFTFDGRWAKSVGTTAPGIRETDETLRSGGNPDGYRRMTHEFTMTTSPAFVDIFVHHIYIGRGEVAGPIDLIRYREDRIKLAPLTTTSAVGGGAVILQNGVYHVAPLTAGQFSNTSWERVEVTLRETDFTPQPDFSANAPMMRFGYRRSNSNRFPLVIEHGIDNWRVEICR
jgi:hypothetical protein